MTAAPRRAAPRSRSRVITPLQIIGVVAALLLALIVIRQDVRAEADNSLAARPIAPGQAADLVISKSDAKQLVTAPFVLESLTEHPALTPVDDFTDPFQRDNGRVVVAIFSCDCPAGDDFLGPSALAVDDRGRRWESSFISASDYAELDGLEDAFDLGDGALRYPEVFMVPPESAGQIRVILEPASGEAVSFSR